MWLDVLGLLLSAVAALLLWKGSEDLPWEIQTIDGKSGAEQAFKRRRRRISNVGFSLLGAGFLLQLLARLL